MVDGFLIAVAVVVPVVILACVIYFVIYFSSPDDKNQAWFPKIMVMLSLLFACMIVLLLPLDVANQNVNGGLQLELVWLIFYMVVAGLCIAVIPFTMFYYESQDPDEGICYQIKWGLIYTILMIACAALTIGLMWAFIRNAEIDYTLLTSGISDTPDFTCTDASCTGSAEILSIEVSLVVYIIAIFSLAGWLVFTVFGGIGLVALPLDMILSFVTRPKRMDFRQYCEGKRILKNRADELAQAGDELKKIGGKNNAKKVVRQYNAFKQAVILLEQDFNKLELAFKEGGGNPWIHAFNLIFGIIFAGVAISWLIHIIVYMAFDPPLTDFLNIIFIECDKVFALFGVLFYGLWTFYLLLAIIKGNVKVGMNLVIFTLHPMKAHDTLMGSFLFNVGIILLGSITITQFVTNAFSAYARGTAVNGLFTVYVTNLQGIKYIFRYLPFVFFGFSILSILLIFICHKSRSRENELHNLIRTKNDYV